MCGKFAQALKNNFYTDYGFYGVYGLTSPPKNHSMNAVLVGEDPYDPISWIIVEPQNDKYWLLNELSAMDYPFSVNFWYDDSGRKYPYIRMYMCSKDADPYFVVRQIICPPDNGFDPWVYDEDDSFYIDLVELVKAANDWQANIITFDQLLEITTLWQNNIKRID